MSKKPILFAPMWEPKPEIRNIPRHSYFRMEPSASKLGNQHLSRWEVRKSRNPLPPVSGTVTRADPCHREACRCEGGWCHPFPTMIKWASDSQALSLPWAPASPEAWAGTCPGSCLSVPVHIYLQPQTMVKNQLLFLHWHHLCSDCLSLPLSLGQKHYFYPYKHQ